MLGWIHEGTVRHRRYGAKPHDFRMSLRMPCVNVDRLQEVCLLSRFWSSNQENLASWQSRDFGFDEHRAIGEEIRDRIQRVLGHSDISNVYLLAHPRYFGHQFNPVSFYFAHNAEGELQAIVNNDENPFSEPTSSIAPLQSFPYLHAQEVSGSFLDAILITMANRHAGT